MTPEEGAAAQEAYAARRLWWRDNWRRVVEIIDVTRKPTIRTADMQAVVDATKQEN